MNQTKNIQVLSPRKGLIELQYDYAKKFGNLRPNTSNTKSGSGTIIDMDSSDEDMIIASTAATGMIPKPKIEKINFF